MRRIIVVNRSSHRSYDWITIAIMGLFTIALVLLSRFYIDYKVEHALCPKCHSKNVEMVAESGGILKDYLFTCDDCDYIFTI